MEKLILIQGLTVDQFMNSLESVIEKKIAEMIKKSMEKPEVKYMTRKEVCGFLRITLPTLHEWTKLGLLPSYKIGNRVLYRSNEIDETLRNYKFKKYRF